MNFSLVALGILIACCFAGWPIVASKAQASGAWIGVLVGCGSIVPSLLIGFGRRELADGMTGRDTLLLIGAGIFNGLGFYLYSKKVADTTIPTAQFVTTISVCMVLVAPLIGWAVKGDVPTLRQGLGYGVGAVAIWLLSK